MAPPPNDRPDTDKHGRPPGAWYRAHNGSVVAGYLEHRDLAEAENEAERFFMNVVLCRVLYTHALVAAPRMSLAPGRSRIAKSGCRRSRSWSGWPGGRCRPPDAAEGWDRVTRPSI